MKTARVMTENKKKKKYAINHNHELCKACGLCYAFCPKKVIEPDILGRAQFVRPDDCIGCMRCVWYCPDFANWVEEVDEDSPVEIGIALGDNGSE